MKFGKELLRAVEASESAIDNAHWLDYKGLKKKLKHMPPDSSDAQGAERIVNSKEERDFFQTLAKELRKVEQRFLELKTESSRLVSEFDKGSEALAKTQPLTNQDVAKLKELLERCTEAHLYILLAENYAVLNYCGFTKILKKHDKLRKTTTRDRYMSKMVNERDFAKFRDVRTVLERLESSAESLTKLLEREEKLLEGAKDSAHSASSNLAAKSSSFDSKKKEFEDINVQGMDRLKSLADTAVNLDENSVNDGDAADSHESNKRQRVAMAQ